MGPYVGKKRLCGWDAAVDLEMGHHLHCPGGLCVITVSLKPGCGGVGGVSGEGHAMSEAKVVTGGDVTSPAEPSLTEAL